MVLRGGGHSHKITTSTKVVYFKYGSIDFIYDYVSMGSILEYYMGLKIIVKCGLLMNLWISAFLDWSISKNRIKCYD